jgi:branched-chain amino acid transport system ATP-binding protein
MEEAVNSTSPEAILLQVDGLKASYGAIQVLWGISLSIPKGQIVCIIGSNGAGKSTTMKVIAGVMRASSGNLRFKGQDITLQPPYERVKQRITLVPEGRQLWAKMTVEENLMLGAFPVPFRQAAHANLARVYEMFPRLKERRTQLAGTLSGGEQQMCAIGRGLMAEPELLMLDEPSLGLAPKVVDEIFDFVRNISKQGVTILLVAQDINYVLRISHYAYLMETGRITLEGPSETVLANSYVQDAYLGST